MNDDTKPNGLRQFDLRPLPERFDAWCTALERRIETLEQRAAALSDEHEALRQRVADVAELRRQVRRLARLEVAL